MSIVKRDFSLNRSLEELLNSFWEGVNSGELLDSNEIEAMDCLENHLLNLGVL
jgi:hypothetical protein|tara:strand:+ start:22 stop:180 length:159 start_codon:yes stop_codon:yes gene_type:complete